jgi:hypothetical protein
MKKKHFTVENYLKQYYLKIKRAKPKTDQSRQN